MIYGYARVSTKAQIKGNSLEDQRQTLLANGCTDITEEQYTGATTHRPKLEELLTKLKPGDTLMAVKLDRIARNVQEGIELIQSLFTRGIKVHILNIGLLENTSMGRFFLTTLLAVAELERCMIAERTQAGKAVARTKAGFKEGRPNIPRAKIELAMSLLEIHSYREVENMTGISRATLCRYKRKFKVQEDNNK